MLKGFLKNWRTNTVRKKFESLTRETLSSLQSGEYDPIEYGNLRKGEYWGDEVEQKILWSFVVDVSLGKPIQYIISYDPEKSIFDCYAKTAVNNFLSVLQFSTSNFNDLSYRLDELAHHIPSLRERSLREYLFVESKRAPRRRWYKPFVSASAKEDYLCNIIENLAAEKRISEKEVKRLEKYIHDLC